MNQNHLNLTLELYSSLEQKLQEYASRGNTIENLVLVISVFTTSGLWLLAAQVIPQLTTWAGAVLSTINTGLVLYLYSSGVNKKRGKAISLHSDVSMFLAKMRGNQNFTEEEFWNTYKPLEHKIRTLGFERE
ncbi:MAG: hypothetical protein WBO24_18275 [Nitrospirales bacterium]